MGAAAPYLRATVSARVGCALAWAALSSILLGCTSITVSDALPEGIPKGYVGFYYLKREGDPPAVTGIYRIENEAEMLEEEKGTAAKRAEVRVEEGMVTPVKIRFGDVRSEILRFRQNEPMVEITRFRVLVIVGEPTPSETSGMGTLASGSGNE